MVFTQIFEKYEINPYYKQFANLVGFIKKEGNSTNFLINFFYLKYIVLSQKLFHSRFFLLKRNFFFNFFSSFPSLKYLDMDFKSSSFYTLCSKLLKLKLITDLLSTNLTGKSLQMSLKIYENKLYNIYTQKTTSQISVIADNCIFLVTNVNQYFEKNLQKLTNGSKTSEIVYTNTSVVKYLALNQLNNFIVLFLRKSRVFNKGRYSRNRQFYRTGVYWCLYLSIILLTGLFYWFYHFILNFGFLW